MNIAVTALLSMALAVGLVGSSAPLMVSADVVTDPAAYEWQYEKPETYSLTYGQRVMNVVSTVPDSLDGLKFPVYICYDAVISAYSELPIGRDAAYAPRPQSWATLSFYALRLYATSANDIVDQENYFVAAVASDLPTVYYPLYYTRPEEGLLLAIPKTQLDVVNYEPIPGDNVGWLYNFGVFLADNIGFFGDILNTQVAGQPVLYLIATSAFTVYIGWVVIKWLIGL